MKALFLIFLVSTAQAAPVIRSGGVVNAASFDGSRGIAQGSLATVFGTGLGPALPGVTATSFPLGTTMAGVSIRLTQGTNSVNALPVFVSAGQANFIVPSNTPTGTIEVRVTYNGEVSSPVTVQIVRSAFGLFTFDQEGRTRAVVQNVVTAADTPVNLPGVAARPGQTLIAYGTGLGPIGAPDNAAAPPGDVPGANIEILIGGVVARRSYAGRSPCCSGLDQLVFEIPPNAPLGCTIPLVVRSGDYYSNLGEISIARDGGRCVEPFLAASGGNYCLEGRFASLLMGENFIDWSFTTPNIVLLSPTANFIETERACFPVPLQGIGTCAVRAGNSSNGGSPTPPSIDPVRSRFLDAGSSQTLRGPAGTLTLQGQSGFYLAPPGLRDTPFVTAGSYRYSGNGGTDVGAFSADFSVTPVRLISPARGATLSASQPPTVTWTGGAETVRDYVRVNMVVGQVLLECVTEGRTGSFTVPPWIWNQIPSSAFAAQIGLVQVTGVSLLNPVILNVPGLPQGLRLLLATAHGYDVRFSR